MVALMPVAMAPALAGPEGGVVVGGADDRLGGGEVRLADIEKHHGRIGVRHLCGQGRSCLGNLHHIKRLNVLCA